MATWNVHAGNGNVEAFLRGVAHCSRRAPPYGIVLLLQETVRTGAEVLVVFVGTR